MYSLQWSWDLKDVSLLERCPHFRGCYVRSSFNMCLTGALMYHVLNRCTYVRTSPLC